MHASNTPLRAQIVIPARLASTRLAEKLLLAQTGKPLIAHTYQAAQRSRLASGVTLAVDHPRLALVAQQIGADWVMTDPLAASGTDRVAEVAIARPEVDIFVNVQGDEPEIAGESIDFLIELLARTPDATIATLATPIRRRKDLEDPACVKVVRSHAGMALYFSRSVIPYPRDGFPESESGQLDNSHSDLQSYLQHLGIYAYRRDFLVNLDQLAQSELERIEKLEQLRFLQAGHRIIVGVVPHATRGIDTREDYDAFLARQKNL
ncbi:MAG: 3-deoxy-manno-octulosonate cytidylyltransferase [Planctomycetota bacterium]|nr:3-deoxy-manno-octulosonate cytidylyltransferase [Planctomycetota bacterium]